MERNRSTVGKISFGAFPRSGSHFFVHLTQCDWLDHKIKPLSQEPNVAVSIRSPLDCVASWIALTADNRLDRADKILEWYCYYYSQCESLKIPIISFEQLITDPETCIRYIDSVYGIYTAIKSDWDLSTNFHYPSADKSSLIFLKSEIQDSPNFDSAFNLFKRLDFVTPIL